MKGSGDPACPACRHGVTLHPVDARTSRRLLRCSRCAGIWAAAEALRSVPERYGPRHPVLDPARPPATCRACRKMLRGPGVTCWACGASQAIDCVTCGQRMGRCRVADVVVDLCRACRSAWFDPGELPVVVAVASAARPAGAGWVLPGDDRPRGVLGLVPWREPALAAAAIEGIAAAGAALGGAPALVKAAAVGVASGVGAAADVAATAVAASGEAVTSGVSWLLSLMDGR
jgi:Zn-finger nucleic acid-binding protein